MFSGFTDSTFSKFLHQNMINYLDDDITSMSNIMDDMSISDLFSSKFGYETKLRHYESVIASRSLSFWNPNPKKG